MAKTVCSICGGEFSNLGVHLNKKHGITREDYDKNFSTNIKSDEEDISDDSFKALDDNLEPEMQEVEDAIINSEKIDAKVLQDNRFDNIVKKDPDRPLSNFLEEFELTEKELRAVVRQYKGGSTVPVNQSLKMNKKQGSKQAQILTVQYKKDGLTQIIESDSWIAEALVKEQGFTCVDILQKPIKKWVLKLL